MRRAYPYRVGQTTRVARRRRIVTETLRARPVRLALLCCAIFPACGPAQAPHHASDDGESGAAGEQRFSICGAWNEGARVDLEIEGSQIAALGPAGSSSGCGAASAVDARDQWVVPSFIDSHVHLAFYPVADELARSGIVATVDLALPLEDIASAAEAPVRQLVAGPMLTATGGYPTQSWGANGYGLEVNSAEAGSAAVEQLVEAGARIIKLPFTGTAQLDDAVISAIVDAARAHGLPVVGHAMDDASAARARELGVDVLAHTPTSPLSPATIEAWADGTVITTLAAFGDDPDARANLMALRAAGTRVLYGTDLGNSRELKM